MAYPEQSGRCSVVGEKELPTLRGEKLYIPFVGAIIERISDDGKKQILVQIREKKSDAIYSGSLEIPGGKLQAFEDIYATVRREVKEECGLDITFIEGEENRFDCVNKGDTSTVVEPFCVTQMQDGPFIGMIFLCRASGEPIASNESREAHWIDIDELKQIIKKTPERIYTAFLAPLQKYLSVS